MADSNIHSLCAFWSETNSLSNLEIATQNGIELQQWREECADSLFRVHITVLFDDDLHSITKDVIEKLCHKSK